jgi:ABC-type multidrug transport system ATPase subunit
VRRRFGILFQSGALFSSMTVGENVALPLKEHTRLGSDMVDLMVKVKLELVGLREAEDRLPSEISGGMAKRAGLARAIALDPELLFYDEPTSGLDPIMTGIIDGLIVDLARTMNVTSVVVTHDLKSAFRVADRMVVLNGGRIVLQGMPHEIRASNDPFVKRFIHGPVESRTAVIPRGPIDRGERGGDRGGSRTLQRPQSSGVRAVPQSGPVPTLESEIDAPSVQQRQEPAVVIPAIPDPPGETPTILATPTPLPRTQILPRDTLFVPPPPAPDEPASGFGAPAKPDAPSPEGAA